MLLLVSIPFPLVLPNRPSFYVAQMYKKHPLQLPPALPYPVPPVPSLAPIADSPSLPSVPSQYSVHAKDEFLQIDIFHERE